ncbi:hypothetical protein OPT61_g248 [Boeremia exigua]|uniref:Uncharacterized protein n=1 Tax=Boeremia exigua TaxID=749465 RepID=A0ACC2IUV2_9PLEO|nr:hypothetical protein OPT61_g248 [Boeremia exigua]
MERRSTMPSGIGIALQQHRRMGETDDNTVTGGGEPLPLREARGRSTSEAHMFPPADFRTGGAAEGTSSINIDGTECTDFAFPPIVSQDSIFREYCRSQPPRRSFLDGQAPPRLRISRRSTLADRPELDSQLEGALFQREEKRFLPVDSVTVYRLVPYLNGSKPLANVSIFERLLINRDTNKVPAKLFIAALEKIGLYCEHLVIVAPFHTIEFSYMNGDEVGNPEPGSDWGKILECLPNVRKITFEDQTKESTPLTRDTFFSLNFALASNTTLKNCVDTEFNVSDALIFAFHDDYHRRQRSTNSAPSMNYVPVPITMAGSRIFYADGAEDFGSLDDDDSVFGKAEH